MRSLAPLACGLSFFLTSAAHSVDQDIELTATVASSCTLSQSTTPGALTANISITNGEVSTTPITFDIPVACNFPPVFTVTTLKGGLRNHLSAPGSTNRIDYVANIAAPHFIPLTFDTGNTSGRTVFEGSAPSALPNGNMTVTITPKQPGQLLREGTYSDTLRITFAPYQ